MNRFAFAAPLLVAASMAAAQLGGPPPPDPVALLAAAKEASGGAAWDALRTQHSKVAIRSGPLEGSAERWSEFATGRSSVTYTLGPVVGTAGFDGKVAWSQEGTAKAQADAGAARELAVNAAYRDRLAFWYPERAPARIAFKEHAEADGAFFDVVRVTPEGGRPFELWINTETKLIERMVEREEQAVRTEVYMDLRDVAGVRIPFRVRATREGAKYDEVVTVDAMEFNVPVDATRFAQPAPPKPDFTFPAGRAFVEIPFEMHSGHVFINVTIDGHGPVRMLLDSGGQNVLLPRSADAQPAPGVARTNRVDVGGVVLERQVFATLDLADFLRRVEGMQDIGGVIGYELLRRMPVKLDYERSRVVLYDPARFKYAGTGTRVAVTMRGQQPRVAGKVDGVPGWFEIDTGSRGSLTLTDAFVSGHGLAGRLEGGPEVVYGASVGGPMRARLARVPSLELGELRIDRPLTMLSLRDTGTLADAELAGNVGNGLLRRFNVTFDLPSGAIYFERNANDAKPEAADRAGMWIERGRAGFEVVDVVAGSPAQAAGLKAGDVIVAMNGRAWTAMSLSAARDELGGAPGRRVTITMAGAKPRAIVLRDLF